MPVKTAQYCFVFFPENPTGNRHDKNNKSAQPSQEGELLFTRAPHDGDRTSAIVSRPVDSRKYFLLKKKSYLSSLTQHCLFTNFTVVPVRSNRDLKQKRTATPASGGKKNISS